MIDRLTEHETNRIARAMAILMHVKHSIDGRIQDSRTCSKLNLMTTDLDKFLAPEYEIQRSHDEVLARIYVDMKDILDLTKSNCEVSWAVRTASLNYDRMPEIATLGLFEKAPKAWRAKYRPAQP